ncbi:MAG: hypothetical protein ABEJ73_06800 [Haloplanus sp.]
MTLADVRAAAVDRALVGDDPATALAFAGAVDRVTRHAPKDRPPAGAAVGDPFAAAMLAVGCVAAERDRPLDDRAWAPGTEVDPLVVAGAAVAVRSRDISVERAADLANCAPATLGAVVESQRRRENEE